MKKIYICLLLIPLILSSCVFGSGLDKMETQWYTNVAGYHITMPADWQLITEDESSAVFTAPDSDISLTIISELGGEAYYGLAEIADMLLEQLPGSSSPWQINRTVTDTPDKLRLAVSGEDESGAEVLLDISILLPYPGIRYYLLFAASRTAANRQKALIDDILTSFYVDKDETYLGELLGKMETQWYANVAGYHITTPADWQLIMEDGPSAVFAAPDSDISLTIISELGGEAYYGLAEIADMLLEQLPGSSSPWQISRTITDDQDILRLAVLGEDESGAEVLLDMSILQPYPGIRYYLLFVVSRAAAYRQGAIIGDILNSFSVDEDVPYLYELMEEWRSQE